MDFLQLFSSENFDLVAVGVAIAAIIITAIGILIADKKSVTNQTFFFFALSITGYAIFNYFSYRIADEFFTLWFLRLSIFFATWASLLLFHFFLVFPSRTMLLPWFYRRCVIPFTTGVALLTLTPFVFSEIQQLPLNGQLLIGVPSFGLAIFGCTSAFLVMGAIILLMRKTLYAKDIARKQFEVIAFGAVITFSAIIVFNIGLPLLFQNTHYILLAPVFFFPFLGCVAYTILRYKLFNIKVATVSLLSFALSVTVIVRVIFSQELNEILFGIGQFILVVFFSAWLIQSIRKEIDQREHIEELAKSLQQANEKLKELDRMKSQFLSIASHDLRSPLTVIRNFMSLLLDGTYGKLPAAGEEGLRQVFERATDMARSVDSYLNVSRIEQGKMKYDFAEEDLVKLVKDAVAGFRIAAEQKGLTLRLSITEDAIPVKVDRANINEVLNNLLDNAIKYTPKGSLYVMLEKRPPAQGFGGQAGRAGGPARPEPGAGGDVARISVKDSGKGITEKTKEGLFKLFSPGEDSKTLNPNSTGVGLYITRAHVEAHGGKIWAESEGEGQGSTFIVELPILISKKNPF